MNSFLSALTPKEPKFFPILKQMSAVMISASEIMIEFLKNYSHETANDYYVRIKEQVHVVKLRKILDECRLDSK